MQRQKCEGQKGRAWSWELTIIMLIQLVSAGLYGLIFILMYDSIHLRWGLGYALIWTALLSPFALMIAARKSRWKLYIRIYSALMAFALWLMSVFCQLLGADIFLPATCYCKDGDYLVRRTYDFFDNKKIGVYKVEDLTERLQSTYSYASLDSIKVYESLNAIAFYCSPHIEKGPFGNNHIGPIRVLEQLTDDPLDSVQIKGVEQLARRRNLKIGLSLVDYLEENE